jgi:hypothetical protein
MSWPLTLSLASGILVGNILIHHFLLSKTWSDASAIGAIAAVLVIIGMLIISKVSQ